MIGGNYKSGISSFKLGLRQMKTGMSGFQRSQYYEPMRIHSVIPVYFNPEERMKKIEKYEKRRLKIMMKGMKKKQGGGVSPGSMGMFNKRS